MARSGVKTVKVTHLLLIGLTILVVALLLSLISMSVYTIHDYVEKEIRLEDSRGVFIDLDRILPVEVMYFNLSIEHDCDWLSIVMLRYSDTRERTVEKTLYRGEQLVLTNLKRWEVTALSFTANNSCRVIILLTFVIYVRPFIWLAIPSFILAIMGSIISLWALISIVTLRLKAKRFHPAR